MRRILYRILRLVAAPFCILAAGAAILWGDPVVKGVLSLVGALGWLAAYMALKTEIHRKVWHRALVRLFVIMMQRDICINDYPGEPPWKKNCRNPGRINCSKCFAEVGDIPVQDILGYETPSVLLAEGPGEEKDDAGEDV